MQGLARFWRETQARLVREASEFDFRRIREKRYWRAKLLAMVIVLVALAYVSQEVKRLYRIGLDTQDETCLNASVYLEKIGPASSVHKGDIVTLRTAAFAPYIARTTKIAKRVVGVPGDSFSVRQLRFYINGEFVRYLNLCHGRYVGRLCDDRHGVVGAGEMLVVADSTHAIDSRYFGPVPTRDIVGSVIWPSLPDKH